jgi:hypothetical protein
VDKRVKDSWQWLNFGVHEWEDSARCFERSRRTVLQFRGIEPEEARQNCRRACETPQRDCEGHRSDVAWERCRAWREAPNEHGNPIYTGSDRFLGHEYDLTLRAAATSWRAQHGGVAAHFRPEPVIGKNGVLSSGTRDQRSYGRIVGRNLPANRLFIADEPVACGSQAAFFNCSPAQKTAHRSADPPCSGGLRITR